MLRRALVSNFLRSGTSVLFHPGGRTEILAPIFDAFAHGIGCGVEGVSSAELQRQQDRVDWNRRVFFREGYGFGIFATHAMTGHASNAESRNRDGTTYRIMHYTGYGFWNGVASTLGLRRISEEPSAWTDVADYTRFGPFMVGGRSFALIARARTVTRELIAGFEGEASPTMTLAAWHGCGRGIWFRAAGAPEPLLQFLTLHPPAAAAMTVGLGVAMAFTQIATPDAVLHSIESMPPRFHDDLAIGAAVALATMIHEDPREEPRVRSLYAGTLGSRVDDVLAAVRDYADDATWYSTFRERLEPAHAVAR
jgi:hypothetical protein